MADITVHLGDRSYTIRILPGLLATLDQEMRKMKIGRKVIVVSDEHVAPLYAKTVLDALTAADFIVELYVVTAGEGAKSLATAMEIYSAAIRFGLDRKSAFVALGGGVVGDLTGFVAATYLRGVPFIQIPTSLLAQVDSSVGGKVAVNHPEGKNLIGAFHQPRAVFIDSQVLQTLSEREFSAGLAEVVKYGLLAEDDFMLWLEKNQDEIKKRQPDILAELIGRSCAAKAKVVEADETENDLRMVLNLGHTIGHSVEAWGGFKRYNHGEAVAIGLCGALILSCRLGLAKRELYQRTEKLLSSFGLPTQVEGCQSKELLGFIAHDKKVLDGAVRWILLEKPGCIKIRDDVALGLVEKTLAEIIK
ncbi:3-dehydroquinate synthase [Azotosporobacter soli]|uniref:3-dehydroquinate synthase n=1 Tax=Azotosporobacter soli TaxID=3055040 RepID=UPI0031FEB82C